MASDQPKSTYIGVTSRPRRRQYQSAILMLGKMHYLGTSETPTDKATTTTKSNPLAPAKRGPGRPRTYPRPEEGEGQKTRMKKQASTAQSDPLAPAKRARGRPRKNPRPEEEGKKTEEEEGQKKKEDEESC